MKNITKFWFLDDFDLIKGLQKKELVTLCNKLEMRSIEKGEELSFINKDKAIVFFLIAGIVKVMSKSTNRTKYIVKNGNIFGELALLVPNNPLSINAINAKAVALESCLICQIEANQMMELIKEPSFDSLKNRIQKLHFLKMQWLDHKLTNLTCKDSRTRVIECIFDYISMFGVIDGDKIVAKNLLSHSDIAHLSNVSRQTVNNVMSALRKENILNYNSKTISILEQTKIRKRKVKLEYL